MEKGYLIEANESTFIMKILHKFVYFMYEYALIIEYKY